MVKIQPFHIPFTSTFQIPFTSTFQIPDSVYFYGLLSTFSGARDSASGVCIQLPGTYNSLKSYFSNLYLKRSILGGLSVNDFLKIDTNGIWSVSTSNCCLYTYYWNRLHENVIPNVSSSIFAYLLSWFVIVLDGMFWMGCSGWPLETTFLHVPVIAVKLLRDHIYLHQMKSFMGLVGSKIFNTGY